MNPKYKYQLPWRVATDADEWLTDEVEFWPRGDAVYKMIFDATDDLVAVVCVEDAGKVAHKAVNERANLFKAAPALLEALKAIRDQSIAVQHSQETRLDDIFDIAKAAIAKAEAST